MSDSEAGPSTSTALAPFAGRLGDKRDYVKLAYQWDGYVGQGTYGIVYKATRRDQQGPSVAYALKRIKMPPTNDQRLDGLSTSACREIAVLKELRHENLMTVIDVHLNVVERSVWFVFEYADFDLYQVLTQYRHKRMIMPETRSRWIIREILKGLQYLHANFILHRDLKPANILIKGSPESDIGNVKIGDLGLARIFADPLKRFTEIDAEVVTIWYRSPELLLGAAHYTKAIDIWALGAIYGEMFLTRPIFHGDLAETHKPKSPYHEDQLRKIVEVLGAPKESEWKLLPTLQHYSEMAAKLPGWRKGLPNASALRDLFVAEGGRNKISSVRIESPVANLMLSMLKYDPEQRITAAAALEDNVFQTDPPLTRKCWQSIAKEIPPKKVSHEEKETTLPPEHPPQKRRKV